MKGSAAMIDQDLDRTVYEHNWADWRRQHESGLAAEHGFLPITSLNWLSAEPQRFDDAPGAWRTGPDGVTVELADGEELGVGGAAVRGSYSFGTIPERGGINAGWGDAVIEVAKRGGHDIVRPRHPDTPLRVQFAGTPAYPPHPRWAVPGRYVPFADPRPPTGGGAGAGLQHG